MKRLIAGFMASAMLFCSVAVSASEIHRIPKLNMEVSFPDEYTVFTRDTSANDGAFAEFKLDGTALLQQMKKESYYADAVQKEKRDEIMIRMSENKESKDIYNFNRPHKIDVVEEAASQLIAAYSSSNTVCNGSYKRIETPQALFIQMNLTQRNDNEEFHALQNITIINGQIITITLNSYSDEITEQQEQALNSVTNSISFTKVKEKPLIDFREYWEIPVIGALLLVGLVIIMVSRVRKHGKVK